MRAIGLVLLFGSCALGTDQSATRTHRRGDSSGVDGAYCAAVSTWDGAWATFEDDVLTLVNTERSNGADCHSAGVFEPAGSLALNTSLRCAARNHSQDMAARDFFDHTNPDNESPWDRIAKTGYTYGAAGENIAMGYPTPDDVIAGWMGSDGHCANIMNATFEFTGIGVYEAGSTFWTQEFAAPL